MVTVKAGYSIVYGKYQFNCQQAKLFIEWLASRGSDVAIMVLKHYQPGTCEFGAWWQDMERLSEFRNLQDKFIRGVLLMKQITLKELTQMAADAKNDILNAAQSLGREPAVYLHWSAGHYGQFFNDYHINIDQDGSIHASTDDLAEIKAHTWHRNSGAIGIAMACCAGATTNNLGDEPPTNEQIESMAQAIAVLCSAFDMPVDSEHVMTHAEAADLDNYGPATTCERWDLWLLPGVEKGEGGNVLRGKAIWYQQNGMGE